MEHFSLSTRHNLFYKCSLIQKSISVFRLQNTSKIFTFFESCHSTRTQIEYCTICFDLQNFIIFPCICACAWVRTHILYAVLLHEIHIFLQCSQLCLNIFGVQRPDYFFFPCTQIAHSFSVALVHIKYRLLNTDNRLFKLQKKNMQKVMTDFGIHLCTFILHMYRFPTK